VDTRTRFPSQEFVPQDTDDSLTDSLDRSYVVSPDALSASDVGSTATVTVEAFTVRWPDQGDVISYEGGIVENLAFSTLYAVYFDDEERDGTVDAAFFATTSSSRLTGSRNRVVIGSITTPADGAGDTSGGTTGEEGLPPDIIDPDLADQQPPIP